MNKFVIKFLYQLILNLRYRHRLNIDWCISPLVVKFGRNDNLQSVLLEFYVTDQHNLVQKFLIFIPEHHIPTVTHIMPWADAGLCCPVFKYKYNKCKFVRFSGGNFDTSC